MSSENVILEITSGPHSGRTFTFDAHDSLLVGRSGDAHLCIEGDEHISRNHCLIEVRPPECHVVDLNSSNGTFVNNERVSDCWLKDGDTIRGGQTQIIVRVGQDDAFAKTMVEFDIESPTFVPDESAEQIGDYELISELGKGSMGLVYKARYVHTDELVAIKVLSPDMKVTEVAQQTFIREAAILCGLSHKRIVRFIEAGSSGNQLFTAMEFVDAVDYQQMLADLSLGRRVKIAIGLIRQVLDGLEYAHGQGLVHRDIKPKNLLVSKDGEKLHARLADFGLAKNFADAGMSQISSEHEIKGTLSYMAPEQIINSRHAKPAADIFSVGATLYSLITGQPIYDLSDHSTPLATILNDGPIPISERIPELPQAVCRIIDKALAHETDDRYRSASDMHAALTKLLRR